MVGYLFKKVLPSFPYIIVNLYYEEIKDDIVLLLENKKIKTKFQNEFIQKIRLAVE